LGYDVMAVAGFVANARLGISEVEATCGVRCCDGESILAGALVPALLGLRHQSPARTEPNGSGRARARPSPDTTKGGALHRGSRCLAPLALCALFAATHAARAETVTGTVQNEVGAGVFNVDIDFIDQCSGNNIFLAADRTAPDGTFSVVVPIGTYDIHCTPPDGNTAAAGELQDRTISGNIDLGITMLRAGRLVSGTVQTPSSGAAAGVDLKFVDEATGRRVYLTK